MAADEHKSYSVQYGDDISMIPLLTPFETVGTFTERVRTRFTISGPLELYYNRGRLYPQDLMRNLSVGTILARQPTGVRRRGTLRNSIYLPTQPVQHGHSWETSRHRFSYNNLFARPRSIISIQTDDQEERFQLPLVPTTTNSPRRSESYMPRTPTTHNHYGIRTPDQRRTPDERRTPDQRRTPEQRHKNHRSTFIHSEELELGPVSHPIIIYSKQIQPIINERQKIQRSTRMRNEERDLGPVLHPRIICSKRMEPVMAERHKRLLSSLNFADENSDEDDLLGDQIQIFMNESPAPPRRQRSTPPPFAPTALVPEVLLPTPDQPITTVPQPRRFRSATQPQSTIEIKFQTITTMHTLIISNNTTMSQLHEGIWKQVNFIAEKYLKDSHLLLLFNHRLHIFSDFVPSEPVSEFLKLTPDFVSGSGPHFYVYAIRREQESDMYTYDAAYDKTKNVFDNSDWWKPVCFTEHEQLARPQSVLLSSLYALQLFFKTNDTIAMFHQALEVQFFIQLRTYLFPPAILALKHAMQGAVFWFEKPLIADAIISLLAQKCPDTINSNELGDCVPLLFCWLLEHCQPNATKIDSYEQIELIDPKGIGNQCYFHDPTTTSKQNRQRLIIEDKVNEPLTQSSQILRHVDIRSLTQYLLNPKNYYGSQLCKSTSYSIYDPSSVQLSSFAPLLSWTEDEIKQLYKTMACKYAALTFITTNALRSDINNQLVLLQNRTVALVLERKNGRSGAKKEKVDHVFHTFNPIADKKRTLIKATDLYNVTSLTTNEQPDPLIPSHLFLNMCTETDSAGVCDPHASLPTEQITVILLDCSRSMGEKYTSSDPNAKCTNADMSMIMLGILSDNLMSLRRAQAFGLIHFGNSVCVKCPITRNRDEFDQALSDPVQERQEWTCMYDAVSKAISLITTYERNPPGKVKVVPDCKKLIICISDGIDNHGATTFEQLHDRLKHYNDIVIDFISFDAQLSEAEDKKARLFHKLCTDTRGYVYRNLGKLNNIQLGATFEQEAAVWLSERAMRLHGAVEKPARKMPAQLHCKAERRAPPIRECDGDSTRNKRLWKEANSILKANMKHIILFVCDDINFWKVILEGPDGTHYRGGRWMLYVEFGPQYPSQAPNVRFITDIYHVNISGDGKICHQILNRGWAKGVSMLEIFENILSLLKSPNFDDAVSTEKAHLHSENPQEYDRQVMLSTQQHAGRSENALKREYQLVEGDEDKS